MVRGINVLYLSYDAIFKSYNLLKLLLLKNNYLAYLASCKHHF
jgi:hypothetical protein